MTSLGVDAILPIESEVRGSTNPSRCTQVAWSSTASRGSLPIHFLTSLNDSHALQNLL